MSTKKTWFITGASQGIGLELVKKVLATGDIVIATSRNIKSLVNEVQADAVQFLPIQIDLTDEQSITEGVAVAINKFGCIDYLVNNAGYGLLGGIEESSKDEVQANFDINVFGLLNVTRAVYLLCARPNRGTFLTYHRYLG